jgi:hypothetical protein
LPPPNSAAGAGGRGARRRRDRSPWSGPKLKNDPKLVAAARELRDRWLERVNATPVGAQGKYDVSRQLEAHSTTVNAEEIPLLDAA